MQYIIVSMTAFNSFILLAATWLNNKKISELLRFQGIFSNVFYDVYNNLCNSAVHRGGFVVVSMVTMVTRIRHIVTLHFPCLWVIIHMIFDFKVVRLLFKRL